jgi:uncharacterized protein
MVNITIWENKESEIVRFMVKDHAGYAEYGFDILCSAISAISIGTLNGLSDYVGLKLNLELKEGYIYCGMPEKMNKIQNIKSQAILKTMDLAFLNIMNEYKEYVKIKRIKL